MPTEHPSDAARFARNGLREAVEAVVGLTDPEAAHLLVGRAVFWASALDEMLRTPEYSSARNTDPDGDATRGARFARNGITHGAVVAVGIADGMTWPVRWPMTFTHAIWTPTSELLAVWTPNRTRDAPAELAAYEAHFSGRSLDEPLLRVEAWLDRALAAGFVRS